MKSDEKIVSIILPTRNSEAFLETCLSSLLSQSYRNLEILMVDNASTDNTREIARKLAGKDERFSLLEKNEDTGVSHARNEGVRCSRGEYFTFVDADDYIGPTYIEDLMSVAFGRDAEVVISGMSIVHRRGDQKKPSVHPVIPGVYERFSHEEWAGRLSLACGRFYKRRLWMEGGLFFDEENKKIRAEDYPVALYYNTRCSRIFMLPKADYFYIQHENQATSRYLKTGDPLLPYQALTKAIERIRQEGIVNGKDFFEWFVLRILTSFCGLYLNAEKSRKEELAAYIRELTGKWFPHCWENPLFLPFTDLDVPFDQKWKVHTLVEAIRKQKIRELLLSLTGEQPDHLPLL